ncbi:hypothetical protein BWQ96_04573 [Gracilariopsis chorda]|uniref:Uncharacterized protein n=1 Tax=Gracilariopsis chorda TaxID=448386 RepID=A0A2V3IU92_9FLOR|nr:hypothetical protein BWQ96_04573 [Gracilariopsis chorda]|eukprot:PXF45669.1 hypothetical protein BWQ96_04573 [Gracilariopsis chorda]
MSNETFRKLPTEWLDVNDNKQVQESTINEFPEFRATSKRELTVDLETISVEESKENSSTPEGQGVPTDSQNPASNKATRTSFFSLKRMLKQEANENGGKTDMDCSSKERLWFERLTYRQIGTGRYLGNVGLLFVRIFFLFMHAISAGIMYGHRRQVDMLLLRSELFAWLQFVFVLLYPLLLWASLLTSRSLNSEDDAPKQRLWTFVAVVFHTLVTFSQVELFRLFLFHFVPRLQPKSSSTAILYSLDSVFARQRYLMFATVLIEFYCSQVPYYPEYLLVTVLLAGVWEIGTLFTRNLDPFSVRIIISIALLALVCILASLNYLIADKFRRSQVNSRQPQPKAVNYEVTF